MLRLILIEKNHKEALDSITKYLISPHQEMQTITHFLLTTDVNPYEFLPQEFAVNFDTSQGFLVILDMVNNALIDDGEMSFPIINKEPHIVFIDKHERNYKDHLLQNVSSAKFYKDFELLFCNDVYDFINKFDTYHLNKLKQQFFRDSSKFGVEHAVKHYSKYSKFDINWKSEVSNFSKTNI